MFFTYSNPLKNSFWKLAIFYLDKQNALLKLFAMCVDSCQCATATSQTGQELANH